jgi:peptidoglycan/xylan/chitin deacetylase (PgdA/CDA1 family)
MSIAFNTGMIRAGRRFWSKSLTVINYHRINDPHQKDFDSFLPNVSAHPDDFNLQMDYLARWFNVVSLRDVINWLDGRQTLPPHAVLITFDDGYLDNYINAYPILQRYGFPAVIFLTTGHIDNNIPFYWDVVAYCFFHSKADHILFPNNTEQSWKDSAERDNVSKKWIESLKVLPEAQKQDWVSRLPSQLDVSIPHNFFWNLMMNWNQAREMAGNRIEFGGHTINHPILTRISIEQARIEIEGSKNKIEKELGQPIFSFAYPNGMQNDLNIEIQKVVANAGYKAAFTLQNGPALLREVKLNPFTIRRVFVSHSHTLSQFAAITSMVNRLRPE